MSALVVGSPPPPCSRGGSGCIGGSPGGTPCRDEEAPPALFAEEPEVDAGPFPGIPPAEDDDDDERVLAPATEVPLPPADPPAPLPPAPPAPPAAQDGCTGTRPSPFCASCCPRVRWSITSVSMRSLPTGWKEWSDACQTRVI